MLLLLKSYLYALLPFRLRLVLQFIIKHRRLPLIDGFSEYLLRLKFNLKSFEIVSNKVLIYDAFASEKLLPFLFKESIMSVPELLKKLELLDNSVYPVIIKPDTGSQNIHILQSKKDVNITLRMKLMRDRLINYKTLTGERCYSSYIRGYIVQSFYENGLDDYKVFCYKGVPRIVQHDTNRFSNHARSFYSLSSFRKTDFVLTHKKDTGTIGLEDLLAIKGFVEEMHLHYEFVRCDLYRMDGRLYIGELTFIPGSGNERFLEKSMDLEFKRTLFCE